jgi:hypothetical protein
MKNRVSRLKESLLESYGKQKDVPCNFELADKYYKNRNKKEEFQVLSDKTCKDLDFQELFLFTDRTTSKVGQQYLYNTLRTIPADGKKFARQEELIKKIESDPKLRLRLQVNLDNLSGENAYFISSLFQDEHIKPPKWFFVIPLLSFTALISLLTLPFIPQSLFILLPVCIVNMAIHYWNKRNLNEYMGSIPQLLRLKQVARELMKYEIFSEAASGVPESIRIIDRVRNRMLFFKLEAKISGEAQIAFWSMMEIVKALFLLEPLLLFGVLEQLETKRKEIENVFVFVGYIDSLISIASLRQGLAYYSLPEVSDENKVLKAQEMYHPLIADCVSNSITTDKKSILLTGSNMSGKTSFIRTVGINVLTALTINTCFARSFHLSRYRIFSAIRISDDLMNDKSYYFEEVLTIKDMIERSNDQQNNLFLLDEIFKGTNTIERISAGKAVLSYLNNNNSMVFVSTHDIELTDLLDSTYELYHFSEKVDNKTVAFDFILKDGKLKNRNAIRILEINDYPEKIISEAIELSKEFDKISGKVTKYSA